METLVGYRFHPTEQELVNHYLKHKMLGNESYVRNAINEVNICKFEPWDLIRKSTIPSDNHVWYFFNRVDYKYPKSKRVNRTTNAGYWKGTGQHREIRDKDHSGVIGTKRTLVFHEGRVPNGQKTDWVMHEYYYSLWPSDQSEYVICKIKYKGTSKLRTGFVDGGESSYPAAFGSQNHVAIDAVSEFDEQIRELMAFSNHFESDDELAQQFTGQSRGVFSQDISFQDHPFNGQNGPHASFDSIHDQDIYNHEADMSDELVNSLIADPDEPFCDGIYAYLSNAPNTINCITKVDQAYTSESSSETPPESPLLELFSSDTETCEFPGTRRYISLDRSSGAYVRRRWENSAVRKPRKGGAALSTVDVNLLEKTSKKDSEKQQFGEVRKQNRVCPFLTVREMHHKPCPPVVYFRNIIVGIILLVILVREVMVVH